MKECELCNSVAKIYCESDQAMLCLECDSRVHGANFLVAKHLRTLLCHLCQSPTPWNGSGSKLGPTVSVCNHCVNKKACRKEININEETHDEDDNDLDNGEVDSSEDDDDAGDEENQVVPWSSTPPVSTSSTSEESFTRSRTVHTLKRMRQTLEPASRVIKQFFFSFFRVLINY